VHLRYHWVEGDDILNARREMPCELDGELLLLVEETETLFPTLPVDVDDGWESVTLKDVDLALGVDRKFTNNDTKLTR
jgi:hypothetical protein